jgi:hypothetical protein
VSPLAVSDIVHPASVTGSVASVVGRFGNAIQFVRPAAPEQPRDIRLFVAAAARARSAIELLNDGEVERASVAASFASVAGLVPSDPAASAVDAAE